MRKMCEKHKHTTRPVGSLNVMELFKIDTIIVGHFMDTVKPKLVDMYMNWSANFVFENNYIIYIFKI